MKGMIARLCLVAFVVASLVIPLAWPYVAVLIHPTAMGVWREGHRISELSLHTLVLVALTLAMAVPLGVAAALLLQAATPRLHGVARWLFLLALATPLPVTTVAWHVVRFGHWSPFAQGVVPAAVLHALAGLPWVVLIVAAGLASCDAAVIDDARMHAGPLVRTLRVTLPMVRGFIGLAALWVAAQTATEIVITDMLQVRTLAEEVYTQAVAPASETGPGAELAVARAVAATLPLPISFALLVGCLLWRQRHDQARFVNLDEQRPGTSMTVGIVVIMIALASVAIPIGNLVRRAGAFHNDDSLIRAGHTIVTAARDNAWLLSDSLIAAIIVGLVTSTIAGTMAGCARSRTWLQFLMLATAIFAAVIPGSIVGLGVRAVIDAILNQCEQCGIFWLRGPLYDGPSLLPAAWVWLIRAWPLAVAVWWPAIARLPREFGEATRRETGSVLMLLKYDVIPTLWRPFTTAAALVTVFSLGEVSGSRLVATPGGQSFPHDVWARMHYGITPDLAGMCLVLLAVVSAVGLIGMRKS